MNHQTVIDSFTVAAEEIFGDRLTGVYLHGSLAMGCFNPLKSDIDLIVVLESAVGDAQKLSFMERVVALNRLAPAKGIEMSVVLRSCCDPFLYPTPFELHFSPAHLARFAADPQGYVRDMNGLDKDLAAHFAVIRQQGITLCGEPKERVFAEVPRSCFIDSVWADVQNAREDILLDPVYVTLNLCRVLAYLREGLLLSKQTGGEWALAHLPETHAAIVSDALACYRSDQAMTAHASTGEAFARAMLAAIREEMAATR